jgi:hypothetical protein
VDFQAIPRSRKWIVKISAFVEQRPDVVHDWVFHNVWNDGRNPDCLDSCELFAAMTCAGFTTGLVLICTGATGGACTAGALGVGVGLGASGTVGSLCVYKIRKYCKANICTR